MAQQVGLVLAGGRGERLGRTKGDLRFEGKTLAELNRLASQIEPAADDPMFVPHLGGRMSPSRPQLRGSWAGLAWSHTAGHLYRAVLEGVALEYCIYRDVLQSVNPPDPVKPSFNEVNQAEQEREQLINEAQSRYNREVPRAAGRAQRTVEEAEGYALDRVNRAQGDAERFRAVFEEYRKAPQVTRQRIYLETLADVLPKVGRKFVVGSDLEGMVPLLDLGGTNPIRRPPPARDQPEEDNP